MLPAGKLSVQHLNTAALLPYRPSIPVAHSTNRPQSTILRSHSVLRTSRHGRPQLKLLVLKLCTSQRYHCQNLSLRHSMTIMPPCLRSPSHVKTMVDLRVLGI